VARGIELDWVVIRVNTIKRIAAMAATGVVAASLVVLAYLRLNLPPDVRAKKAIERAQSSYEEILKQPIPDGWAGEVGQAKIQLDNAQTAYADELWEEAVAGANDARSRFEALMGAGKHELVGVGQFFSLEGRVTVQRAGKGVWDVAQQRMPVFNGDFVRSSRDGTAEILFVDGSLYRLAPNSLLEIHHQQKTDRPSAVKMLVGQVNVYTSSSGSTITTGADEEPQTEVEVGRESQVAVGISERDKSTTIATYEGGARVRNPRGETLDVGSREQVVAVADGSFTEKKRIPDPPQPIAPLNNAGFEMEQHSEVELSWRRGSRASQVHLQVNRSKRFLEDEMDVDAEHLGKDSARLQAIAPGTYYWRIATVEPGGVRSEWSAVRRFRIYSSDRKSLLSDSTPPVLDVSPPHQLGHIIIVEGRTEVGATVTINGEPVELDGRGQFRKTVEVLGEGWNDVVIAAVDPSGNRSERREKVFVEVY
jgi:hypothetical protein